MNIFGNIGQEFNININVKNEYIGNNYFDTSLFGCSDSGILTYNINDQYHVENISNEKCIIHNCFEKPVYDYISEENSIYCEKHIKSRIIYNDIKHCIENNCLHIPYYNYSNEKIRLYCDIHKKDGMVKKENCIQKKMSKENFL